MNATDLSRRCRGDLDRISGHWDLLRGAEPKVMEMAMDEEVDAWCLARIADTRYHLEGNQLLAGGPAVPRTKDRSYNHRAGEDRGYSKWWVVVVVDGVTPCSTVSVQCQASEEMYDGQYTEYRANPTRGSSRGQTSAPGSRTSAAPSAAVSLPDIAEDLRRRFMHRPSFIIFI